jgi:hypothetical protein
MWTIRAPFFHLRDSVISDEFNTVSERPGLKRAAGVGSLEL